MKLRSPVGSDVELRTRRRMNWIRPKTKFNFFSRTMLNIHHHTNLVFFFSVVGRMCSLPRSRFLDVTQRERCVTSKNRLLGRLSHVKIDVCSEDDLQTARTCWMIQAHIQTNRLTVPDVVELFMNFNSLSLVHLVKSSTFGLGLTGEQCYFPFTSQNHPGGN